MDLLANQTKSISNYSYFCAYKYVNIIHIFSYIIDATIIVGNLMTIFIIWMNKELHSKLNALIFSLSVADFFVGLSNVFLLSDHYIWNTAFSNSLINTFFMWAGLSSMAHLFVITIERYVSIIHALRYNQIITVNFIRYFILAIYILSFTLSVVPLLIYYFLTRKIYVWITLICTAWFILNGIFMVVMYIRIHQVAHKQIREIKSQPSCNHGNNTLFKEIRVTVTLTMIMVAYIISWTPMAVSNMMSDFGAYPNRSIKCAVEPVVQLIALCNSSVNVFLYAWRNREFRSAYKKMIGCRSK